MLRKILIPAVCLLYIVAAAFAIWGFAAGRYGVWPASTIQPMADEVAAFFKSVEEDDRDAVQKIVWHRQERPKRFEEGGFVQRDAAFSDPGYLLLSYFDREQDQVLIDLVRLSDFEVLHRWTPPVDQILAQGPTDLYANSREGYRAQHPYLLEDGSLLFTSGEGPLVKIDRESNLIWLVNRHFHHSIERDHAGNFLLPVKMTVPKVKLNTDFRDDGFAVVSPDGEVLAQYSVAEMLIDNGYDGLFFGTGVFEPDRIHLNDAEPILMDRGVAQVGDVGLSVRQLSTVLLFRPLTGEILWLKTGPWLYQHDIDQLKDGRYSVFGNDMFKIEKGAKGIVRRNPLSQIYVYDPETDAVETPWAEILEKEYFVSSTEGRSRVLPNGDLFVEETNSNRLLRVSPDRVRWQFVNNVSEDASGALHWCRYLNPDEVDLSWLDSGRENAITQK